MKSENSRRSFIKKSLFFLAAFPLANLTSLTQVWAAKKKEVAPPAGETPVSEADAVASAVGYHHDATKTDYSRYPQRKKPDAKNQFCENCALYTKLNEGWGRCQLITAGVVNAKGWCGSYSKKS
jgi:hypothetical protein